MTCVCEEGTRLEAAQAAADSLMEETALFIEREREGKIKRVDIRPFIHSILAEEIQNGRLTFVMTLGIGIEGVAKPQEIVSHMAKEIPGLAVRRVHRVRLMSRKAIAGDHEMAG